MPRSTRKGLYRVIYLVKGRRAAVPATLQFDAAMREFAALKRRGFTAWIESDSGEFVPVEGAMRKPSEIAEAPRRRLSRPNLRMTPEAALQLAGELSQQVSGSKPRSIPGGYRFSDKNEAAQFTTYSPEYSQKVVCVVSVFEDGSTAVGIFSDEGLSGTATYENIAHFTYDGADVSSMVKDIEWVWKTVDGYAASWQEDDGGEVDEHRGAKREPSFKRVGARVKYNYTDGPIPAGTLGTIIGFLPRSYQAQIRWDNETVNNHTPDEYDMIHRGTKAAEARRPTKSTPAWQSRRIDLNFAGYDFTSGPDGTVIHRDALPPRVPGKDYGADPIGDGTFRMVPSGDIVDFDERNRRLKPIR